MDGASNSSLQSHANPDTSHIYTTMEYPEHVNTEELREQFKKETLSHSPEELFADCDKTGKITNLILFTDNSNAWHQATLEHYEQHTITKQPGNGSTKKIDIFIGEKKTSVSCYKSGYIVINSTWETFMKDFPKIKAIAQTKKLLQKGKQDKSLSTEPNWPAEIKEIKDKLSLLEVWQVQMEEQVKKCRPDSNASNSDTEQLRELLRRHEERAAQDKSQFKKEIESLRESLTQERAQREEQVKNLREEVTELTRKLEEERMQNRHQPEREERGNRSVAVAPNPDPQAEQSLAATPNAEQGPQAGQSMVESSNPERGPRGEALTPTTADPPGNAPVQTAQIVLLMDSNGKYVDGKRLFPNHRVNQQKCPNTRRAIDWLTEEKLGAPSHIIIHTGTNNLRTQRGEQVAKSVMEVVEKATSTFPGKKIIISALLPRKDDYGQVIPSINALISRECAMKQNVYFASHPTLDQDSLWDEVHLRKVAVPVLAKKLKDVALERNTDRQPPTTGRGQPRGHRAPPKQPNAFRGHFTPHQTHTQANPPIHKATPHQTHTPQANPPIHTATPHQTHTPQANPPIHIATPHQTHTPPHMHTQEPHPTTSYNHTYSYAQAVNRAPASPSQSGTTFLLNTLQIQQIIGEVLTRTVQANTGI